MLLCMGMLVRWLFDFINKLNKFTCSVTLSINHSNQSFTHSLVVVFLFCFYPFPSDTGQANLAAVLTFVFSMLFGGLFLNNSTVTSSSSTSDGDQTVNSVRL
jgi:hypothetical protein